MIKKTAHIAPLATFRVLFGGIMLISVIRFMAMGWVEELYIKPGYFFTYWGFDWVKPIGETGLYLVFIALALSALLLMLGLFYRLAAPAFFLLFTYTELLDKTNYLNHYYFVSIVAFILIFLPAHRYFSLDVMRNPTLKITQVPAWMINGIKLQLGLVYFFAGLAKLNPDWLFEAQPLKIWLPARSHFPLVGPLFNYEATAFIFCWAGAMYDLSIPFLLYWRKTRGLAYLAVIGFHLMTWLLFPIGMFPFIMVLSTLIFFSEKFHLQLISKLSGGMSGSDLTTKEFRPGGLSYRFLTGLFLLHFSLQILLPFRYLLYSGNLFWTEQGYRFSWRVMLMEKAGYAIFTVTDPETGQSAEVTNSNFLTLNQEKMMATQPDMILQFAHYLDSHYRKQGVVDPEVRARVYVTLNGKGSRPFVDSTVDLSLEKESLTARTWVLPDGPASSFALRKEEDF